MPGFITRVKKGYNAFKSQVDYPPEYVIPTIDRPSIPLGYRDSSDRVIAPVITRMAMDASIVEVHHVDTDEFGDYVRIHSGPLNDRLSLQANIDQTGRAFIHDAVMTLLLEGSCAIVPVDTSANPKYSTGYDIYSLRVGRVTGWHNRTVDVSLYNENLGERVDISVAKSYAAIVYNPLSYIMNEPNSTLRRLQTKLQLLDASDARNNSPNLDLILQMPFPTRVEGRQRQARNRLADLEKQLAESTYGVAYVGAAEKITQLNRPVANTLQSQVELLQTRLYNQLGLTEAIFNGTADEREYNAYLVRTIGPILNALLDSMKVAFLTRTAITQGQTIRYFNDLFKMASLTEMADSADKFGRNAIVTSNEFRALLGRSPRDEPDADRLRNKNMNLSDNPVGKPSDGDQEEVLNGTKNNKTPV